ncbi:MAG: SAM-dependent chlorinase/fluorinase [Desulfobacterales bacterium]|jgi:hypothetical protein
MSVISLLTDFGTDDEYVGLVKAVIYGIAPHAVIVDLCHRLDPHDIPAAALLLAHAWPYFPEGSVHVTVVDPGVGSRREILAVQRSGHLFVAPDNGVLTPIFDGAATARIVKVRNRSFFRNTISRTFHGRDIFAPVAAHLSLGVELDRLGPPADGAGLCRIQLPAPQVSDRRELVGAVVWIDRFGNLITNIAAELIDRLESSGRRRRLSIEAGGRRLFGIADSYARVEPGEPLAIIGSRGTLEIAVNCGNAADFFGCRRGDPVRVRPDDSGPRRGLL